MLLNSKKLTRCVYDSTIEFLETNKTTNLVVSDENVAPKVNFFY